MLKFDQHGYLDKGTHVIKPQEFIDLFCNLSSERKDFKKSITDLFDFSQTRGAIRIFIGGSFVSNKPDPDDIDALIIFSEPEQIPYRIEEMFVGEVKLDILFCLESEVKTRDALLTLYTKNRQNRPVGVIQVDFTDDTAPWKIVHEPDDDTLEIIKRAYTTRKIIDVDKTKGVIVTIHGILSHATWNFDLIPIANSQGWIVAPFHYGWVTPFILMSPGQRLKVLEKFREWISNINNQYPDLSISIIAHSLGTYIIGAYLEGFNTDKDGLTFNSIILTGAILSEDFDWDSHHLHVGVVRNEKGLADFWVKLMLPWFPGRDALFGKSGVKGFTKESKILEQHTTKLLDHSNTFKKDMILSRWLPFLNANKNIQNEIIERNLKIMQDKYIEEKTAKNPSTASE